MKVVVWYIFATPHLFLAIARLMKVIFVQRSGATCMVNDFAFIVDNKPPLGTVFLTQVKNYSIV